MRRFSLTLAVTMVVLWAGSPLWAQNNRQNNNQQGPTYTPPPSYAPRSQPPAFVPRSSPPPVWSQPGGSSRPEVQPRYRSTPSTPTRSGGSSSGSSTYPRGSTSQEARRAPPTRPTDSLTPAPATAASTTPSVPLVYNPWTGTIAGYPGYSYAVPRMGAIWGMVDIHRTRIMIGYGNRLRPVHPHLHADLATIRSGPDHADDGRAGLV